MDKDVTIQNNVTVSILYKYLYQWLTVYSSLRLCILSLAICRNIVCAENTILLVNPLSVTAIDSIVTVYLILYEVELKCQTPFCSLCRIPSLNRVWMILFLYILLHSVDSEIVLDVDACCAVVVQLQSSTIWVSESLLWRIPYMNSFVEACVYSTLLVAFTTSCSRLIQIRSCSSVLRILAPYQAFKICLLWLNQSIVRCNDSVVTTVVLCANLKCDSVSLLVCVCCRVVIQELWVLDLQACCQDTIVVQEQVLTSCILLWRSYTEVRSLCTSIIVNYLWLQYIVTLDILVNCIRVRRIHVIIYTPSWTIVEYLVVCTWLRGVSQVVWTPILKTRDTLWSIILIVLHCRTANTSQVCYLVHGSVLQPWVNYSLNTVKVQVWHVNQATEISIQRDYYCTTCNTINTVQNQCFGIGRIQNTSDTITRYSC